MPQSRRISKCTVLLCWFNRPRLNQNVSVQATRTLAVENVLVTVCSGNSWIATTRL